MVDGQVGFFRPENIRRVKAEKNNSVVNALTKTKVEKHPDLFQEQQDRKREIVEEQREKRKAEEKARLRLETERKREKEARSYDRIMKSENMTSNADFEATADNSAAEAYEEDFF